VRERLRAVVDFKEMERVRADSGALVRRLAGERD
jgi:hypothetical protein